MSEPNALEHYQRREQKERILAAAAIDPAIAAIHAEMADHYSDLIEQTSLASRSAARLKFAGPT